LIAIDQVQVINSKKHIAGTKTQAGEFQLCHPDTQSSEFQPSHYPEFSETVPKFCDKRYLAKYSYLS
jgi:hypothetical protein